MMLDEEDGECFEQRVDKKLRIYRFHGALLFDEPHAVGHPPCHTGRQLLPERKHEYD